MGEDEAALDDTSLDDDVLLLRRIPPAKCKPQQDGSLKVPSDTFKDNKHGSCSVDLYVDDQQPIRMLDGHDGFGLVTISVGEIRGQGLGIIRDPIEDDLELPDNPNHALITGDKSRRCSKILSSSAKWHTQPS